MIISTVVALYFKLKMIYNQCSAYERLWPTEVILDGMKFPLGRNNGRLTSETLVIL